MTISTISGSLTSPVTLAAGPDTATLIITNSGVITTGTTASPLVIVPAQTLALQYDVINQGQIDGDTALTLGSGILLNAGTIAGQSEVFGGTALGNEGLILAPLRLRDGSLANTGSIIAKGKALTGADLYVSSFFNSGLISGGSLGVAIDDDLMPGATAVNAGIITGGTTGLTASGATTVANEGTIKGGLRGLTGTAVFNSGTILGGSFGAYMVANPGHNSFALNNSGVIAGGTGIGLRGDGTIIDSGTISGASYAVLDPGGTLSLTFTAGAALYGRVTVGAGIAVLDGALPKVDAASLSGFGQIEFTSAGSLTGLINTGSFSQSSAAGLSLATGGSVTNSGTITASGTLSRQSYLYSQRIERYGATGLIAGGAVSITNTGLISGLETGISLAAGGNIFNAGTITATGRYDSYAYRNFPVYTSTVSYGPATALLNAAGALALTVTAGAAFNGAVTDLAGDGALTLASGSSAGTLDITSFSGFSAFEFAAGAGWTLEGTTSQLATGETISNFRTGDTIILDGTAASLASYYPGFALILTNSSNFPMLHFADGATAFDIATDGHATTITAACFCRGTRIATPQGEVPVEDLAIGDAVLTLHAGAKPIKWIGRRAYAAPFAEGDFIRPLRLRPGALDDDTPRRTLQISPGHALYLGGALVPAWRLLNGASVVQAAHVELVEYFHIELETQEVIFAEACPVESYIGAALRGQFRNAAEFSLLYPYDEDQSPCLPLLEDGFALEAIKARVAQRAGLPPAPPGTPGPLRGFVDVAGPASVEGWAQDETAPEQPVALDILRAGRRLARILANRYRADLRMAGLGSGCHAFRFPLPPGEGEIAVVRAADGAVLPLTDAAVKVA